MAVLDHNYDHNGKNEGVGTVSQVKIRQKNRTTKALNIVVFRVFNHPCYYYEPVGRRFESCPAYQKAIRYLYLMAFYYVVMVCVAHLNKI